MMPETNSFDHAKFARVCAAADARAQAIFGHMPDMQGRKGAYYCAGDSDGIAVSTIGVGTISTEKRHKYKRICEKKVADVTFLKQYAGKERSRDCAKNAVERYTGGIAVAGGAYGVSGYTADVDECLAIGIAYCMGDITEAGAEQLLWDNPLKVLGMRLLRESALAHR